MSHKLSRRDFLKASALATVAAAVQACAQPTPQVIEKEVPVEKVVKETVVVEKEVPVEKTVKETVVVEKEKVVEKVVTATPEPAKYKEAPMLAELVKAGKLPPVEERLPIEPKVFPVMEMIGKYGGTIRRCFSGVSDSTGPNKHIDRGLVWFDSKFAMQPRIAQSWEVNADGSEWTFHLRKGMKWSDGAPFTSGDIMWWWNNDRMNRDIVPSGNPGSNWVSGPKNTPATLTAPDDYTIKFTFTPPKPLFIIAIGRQQPWIPGHYMQQFHMDFVKDKAAFEKEYKDKGFNDWQSYYGNRNTAHLNPDRPGVGGWVYRSPLSEEMFIMERNPYFFGVDEEGQQLPYVDKIQHRLFGSADVKNMWVINGEIDFQARHMTYADFTLYKESEAKGGYKVFLGIHGSHLALNTNHTTKEPKLREFFQNRDVRIALSLAVNRDELNDLLYEGIATPRQYSPISMSAQYYPKLSNAYIEYDPKKANELLDKAGYDKRGADGFRLWKDGSGPLGFIIEGTDQPGTPAEDGILMVCKYFADVGIKATYNYAERSLYTQHYNANDIESAWWGGDRSVVPLVAPWIWLGRQTDRPWCNAWSFWYSDPTSPNAEEPPKDHWIRTIWDIWDNQVSREVDSAKQTELFFKILDIWAEELPYPCYLGEIPQPIIVKNGFRNYLNGYPVDDPPGDEHLLNTETYFWEEPEKHTV